MIQLKSLQRVGFIALAFMLLVGIVMAEEGRSSSTRLQVGAEIDGEVDTSTDSLTVQERLENAREQLKERMEIAKQRLNEAKKNFQERKDDWELVRKEIKEGKAVDRVRLFESSKSYVLSTTNRILQHLEQLDNWGQEHLEESDYASFHALIQTRVDSLNALTVKVEATQTAAELKALIPEVRQAWKNARLLTVQRSNWVLVRAEQQQIDRLKTVAANVQTRVEALRTKGVDLTAFDAKMATFNEEIASAQTKLNEAKAAFEANLVVTASVDAAVDDEDSAEKSINNGRVLLREAHQLAVDARHTLNEAIKSIFANVRALRSDDQNGGNSDDDDSNNLSDDDQNDDSSNDDVNGLGDSSDDDNEGDDSSDDVNSDVDDDSNSSIVDLNTTVTVDVNADANLSAGVGV